MSKIILVTGGARSGKSTFAEKLTKNIKGQILYIATAIPIDDEMEARINVHQQRRDKNWITYEGYQNLDECLKNHDYNVDAVLLDCVTIWVTNLFFDYVNEPDFEQLSLEQLDDIECNIEDEINRFISKCQSTQATVILVTNEVGFGLVPESKMGRVFRDILGRMNQRIAQASDEVYLVISGISMKIK